MDGDTDDISIKEGKAEKIPTSTEYQKSTM